MEKCIITTRKLRVIKIADVLAVVVMAFIWYQIPIYADSQPALRKNSEQPNLSKITDITCLPILYLPLLLRKSVQPIFTAISIDVFDEPLQIRHSSFFLRIPQQRLPKAEDLRIFL